MLIALVLTGCAIGQPAPRARSLPTPATTTSEHSPAPTTSSTSPGPLAVLVDFPNGTGPQNTGYDLTLIAASARAVAHAHAAVRSFIGTVGGPGGAAAPDLPEISVANGRVYYLDGDSTLRYLAADGSTGAATKLPGSATAHAGFAVRPDGLRIAVSVLTYEGNAASMNLYVEDIRGGNHHDLFQSSSEYAWPVAWRGTDLVLALGPLFSQQGLVLNPYFASSYHVVDSATADRKAAIGGPDYITGCEVSGLLVPGGTACYHRTASSGMGGEFWILDWTGARIGTYGTATGGTASLSPRQPLVALLQDDKTVAITGPEVKTAIGLGGVSDSWPCWLDDQHVLVGSVHQHQFQTAIIDARSSNVAAVGAHGFCAAVLGSPGELQ